MLPTLAGRTDVMSRLTGCFVTSFVRLELLVLVVGGDPPTWWMCMPLLVGLAGADCVSEDVSRMRWGRALTVA